MEDNFKQDEWEIMNLCSKVNQYYPTTAIIKVGINESVCIKQGKSKGSIGVRMNGKGRKDRNN